MDVERRIPHDHRIIRQPAVPGRIACHSGEHNRSGRTPAAEEGPGEREAGNPENQGRQEESGVNLLLREVHSTELDQWIADRHYLHNTPAGAILRLEFLNGTNRVGAMMWGRNSSPKQDQKHVLCLTRMCFVDNTEPYIESRALAMARKYIRKHKPEIRGLVAYSSTGQGHRGTIYQADGWFEVSRSKGRDCRPGRKNIDTSEKIKWCRTP